MLQTHGGEEIAMNNGVIFPVDVSVSFGIELVSSPHLVNIKFKVRGIPSKNNPNRYRPFYRRVKVVTPLIILDKVNRRIICHTTLVLKIKAQIAEQTGMWEVRA